MSVRARRRVPQEEHSGPDERWMASYLDMVTVLMCMFIVLFAMSTVDQEKFEALSASLATGFGQEPSDDVDAVTGVVVPPELVDEDGDDFVDVDLAAAQTEFSELSALREKLRRVLADNGLEADVTFTIDERGLTIGLVSAETFFTTNSTALSPTAVLVLDALGSVLVTAPNEISVEGHADVRGSVAPYPTNWELSAGRSTQVLRHLVESSGLPPSHLKSVGFGDTRPIAAGNSSEALAQNRRVDIVVLSDANEEVRALLPEAQAAQPSS
ncbi:flagellar motor protein MotB [Microbacterium sp. KSW4-16]|uniref:OmpA/MotB family protein n=1 Tax=Microbacterium aurugineum TaxID=2851642 RepID=UPI0020BF0E65|nr:flagellar motor protein MotB [Microbacterium aurugineum]MCK8466903.1 flagellar motor protein MotB [Microbacterium aurugineum]